jgi:hypothetical protein
MTGQRVTENRREPIQLERFATANLIPECLFSKKIRRLTTYERTYLRNAQFVAQGMRMLRTKPRVELKTYKSQSQPLKKVQSATEAQSAFDNVQIGIWDYV